MAEVLATTEDDRICAAKQPDISVIQHFLSSLPLADSPQRIATPTQSEIFFSSGSFIGTEFMSPIFEKKQIFGPLRVVSVVLCHYLGSSECCVCAACTSDQETQQQKRGCASRSPAWAERKNSRDETGKHTSLTDSSEKHAL